MPSCTLRKKASGLNPLLFILGCASLFVMDKAKKQKIIAAHAEKEGDTGSPAVQIALLTERINHLTEHLKAHKQDKHSRRGLYKLVDERKAMIRYMEKTDLDGARALKKKLGIR